MEEKFEIRYAEFDIDAVMRYFARDFEAARIVAVEWWVDPMKGKVLFRITGEPSDPPKEHAPS